MARQSQRISFESFAEMAAHLDRWAASSLTSPAAWEDVLVGTQSWLDYSARNQILLASYGADGPVAGVETWRLVPSTHEDRGCAVRAGEHGYPVRVPVTTGGTEPDEPNLIARVAPDDAWLFELGHHAPMIVSMVDMVDNRDDRSASEALRAQA